MFCTYLEWVKSNDFLANNLDFDGDDDEKLKIEG